MHNCSIDHAGDLYIPIIEICGITINLRTVISMPFVLAQYGYPVY